MRTIPQFLIFAACVAAFGTALRADEFQLRPIGASAAGDSRRGAETEPATIEGVLLQRDAGFYTIRVVGGRVSIPVDRVLRRIEDDLTIADIEAREAARADELAAADERRERRRAQRHEDRRERRDARSGADAESAGDRGRHEQRGARARPAGEAAEIPPALLRRARREPPYDTVELYDPILDYVVEYPVDEVPARLLPDSERSGRERMREGRVHDAARHRFERRLERARRRARL